MAHGEFGKWLESIRMNDRMARKFMTVARELAGKRTMSSEIGLEALYQIATIPPDQRDQPHTVPSTGETKTIDEMTVRELREVKKALKETQDKLSKNGYRCFERWLAIIGMNKMQANRLIQRYSLVTNCDDQTSEFLEDLPVSLTYEIAKPSAESTPAKAQAKAEVLVGNIDTLIRYKERVSELERQAEEADRRAKQAEAQQDTALRESDILRDTLESREDIEPEVRTEYPDFFA